MDIKLNPALLVLVNSVPIELSVRQNDFNNQSIDYGGMVASNVTTAIMCLERGSVSSFELFNSSACFSFICFLICFCFQMVLQDTSGHKLVGNVTTAQSSAQKLCCQAASKTATYVSFFKFIC